MCNRWTPREVKQLEYFHKEGVTDREAAEAFVGRSPRAITCQRLKLGLRRIRSTPKTPWTSQEVETALGLLKQGLTRGQIARELRRPRNSVIKKLWTIAKGVYHTTSK